jgi:hypothetical protein
MSVIYFADMSRKIIVHPAKHSEQTEQKKCFVAVMLPIQTLNLWLLLCLLSASVCPISVFLYPDQYTNVLYLQTPAAEDLLVSNLTKINLGYSS